MMNNKQKIIFKYYVDAEMQDYNLRSTVVDRHIKDVYPDARTVMRYNNDLQKYDVTVQIETFVSGFTKEIIGVLASIMVGVLQLDSVTYKVGLHDPVKHYQKLKESRDSWYTDAGLDEEQTA